MDLLHDARVRGTQLVLHLHRLDHHQTLTQLHNLASNHFDAHHQPRHRRFHDAADRRLASLPREGLDLLRAVVLNLDFHALAGRAEGPAPWVELLAGDGPGVFAQQEMKEGRAWDRRRVRLEPLAVDRHGPAIDVDDVGAGTERDVVLQAASNTATVSTCAVCGNRSNARTAVTS